MGSVGIWLTLKTCRANTRAKELNVCNFSWLARMTASPTRAHLLPSRQVGNVLPTFLRRHDAELDALGEWIHAVHEFQLCVTT